MTTHSFGSRHRNCCHFLTAPHHVGIPDNNNHNLQVAILQVTIYKLQLAGYDLQLRFTNYKLQVANCR